MCKGLFPKIGVPPNGWFIRENPIKMDDLGVHLFWETPIYMCVFEYFFQELTRVCMIHEC